MSEPQHLYHHKAAAAHHQNHAYYLQPRPFDEEAPPAYIPTSASVIAAHRLVATPHSNIPTHYSYIHPHTKGSKSIKGTSLPSSSLVYSSTAPLSSVIVTTSQYTIGNGNEASQALSNHSSENGGHLVLLVAVFGTLGLISSAALLFCCCRKRRKTKAFSTMYNQPYTRKGSDYQQQQQQQQGNARQDDENQEHNGWASSSTINTLNTAVEGKPFYYDTEKRYPSSPFPTTTTAITATAAINKMSVKEKRLTADTLVDEATSSSSSTSSFMLIKKQYAPQLALSPSLSADVVGGYGLDEYHQAMNSNDISPSNTLIDNAGVLSNLSNEDNLKTSTYYYFDYNSNNSSHNDKDSPQSPQQVNEQQLNQQRGRRKIELYEPQVNCIQNTMNDVNPFNNTP